MQVIKPRNPQADILQAQAIEGAAWWLFAFEEYFIDLATARYLGSDGWAQRGGGDWLVMLEGGKTNYIDIKLDWTPHPRFFLETWSNYEHRTPGWIAKSQLCDYIAYYFVNQGMIYFVPFPALRRAWVKNQADWLCGKRGALGEKSVTNRNNAGYEYTTKGVPVPIPELRRALDYSVAFQWVLADGDVPL